MKLSWKRRILIVLAAVVFALIGGSMLNAHRAGPVYKGKRVGEWVAQLSAENGNEVRDAQNALTEMGPLGVPYLTAAMHKLTVSKPASWFSGAMRKILPRRFHHKFLSGIQKEMVQARMLGTFEKLGTNAAPAALEIAVVMRSTENVHVRSSAAEALGRIGPGAVEVIRAGIRNEDGPLRLNYYRAASLLGTNGATLLPDLVYRFEINPMERPNISLALHAIREESLPLMTEWLMDSDSGKVKEAIRALASGGTPDASLLPRFLELAEHPNKEVRQYVAVALGGFAPLSAEARRALSTLLNDADPRVQISAMRSISQNSRYAVDDIPRFLQLAREGSPEVRLVAVTTLGQIGRWAHDAGPALREMVSELDANDPLTKAIGMTLEHITRPSAKNTEGASKQLQQR